MSSWINENYKFLDCWIHILQPSNFRVWFTKQNLYRTSNLRSTYFFWATSWCRNWQPSFHTKKLPPHQWWFHPVCEKVQLDAVCVSMFVCHWRLWTTCPCHVCNATDLYLGCFACHWVKTKHSNRCKKKQMALDNHGYILNWSLNI